MSHEISPGIASNEELGDFLNVGDDKRREIMIALGLSPGREHDWTEIWASLGLAPVQRHRLWDELRAPMLDVAEVVGIIGKQPKTVSGWCKRGEYPPRFPAPFDFGPRTKRWIGLEVWASRQPDIYGKDARRIVRPSTSSRKVLQPGPARGPLLTTLDPLPFS